MSVKDLIKATIITILAAVLFAAGYWVVILILMAALKGGR